MLGGSTFQDSRSPSEYSPSSGWTFRISGATSRTPQGVTTPLGPYGARKVAYSRSIRWIDLEDRDQLLPLREEVSGKHRSPVLVRPKPFGKQVLLSRFRRNNMWNFSWR
jgi:hypothetical protein